MTGDRLVLRADGGAGVGAGHVARCLALAEAWQDAGGDALLAVDAAAADHARRMSPTVDLAVLDVEPGTAEDARTTTSLSAGAWLVIDGYRFSTPARPGGERVLVIDDFGHGGRMDASIILDQNLGGGAACYRGRRAGTRLLLGPAYALLRGDRPVVAERPAGPATILVSVGGEPLPPVLDHFRAVVAALMADGTRVEVIGGASPDDLPVGPEVAVHGFLDDPGAVIARADVAVAAAGSTLYALCRAGVPAVVVPFHTNQEPIARSFHAAGAAVTPADPTDPGRTIALLRQLLVDDERRRRLGSAAAALVDGGGAARVVAELRRS